MNYYQLVTPIQWRAGFIGSEPNKQPFYFDCADCNAKAPVIHGYLASSPKFEDIGLLGKLQGCNLRLALFCESCFAKRLATTEPAQELAQAI
jgi:hypothetical protein